MLAAQLRNAGRSLLRNGRSIATSPAARGLDELIVTVPKEAPQPVGA